MPTGSPAAVAEASTMTALTSTIASTSTSPPLTGDNRAVMAPSSSSSSSHQPRLSQTNLYIRGLSPDTTDKDLVNLCQP